MNKPDVKTASYQEIFDYVTSFLFKQNERAFRKGVCVYKTETKDGKVLKCAVGALMSDEMDLENLVGSVFFQRVQNALGLDWDDKEGHDRILFLKSLQKVHDKNRVNQWHVEFAKVADQFGLKFI